MKVFCTGANGFIGSHIVKKLVDNGDEVVSFDLATPVVKLKNVEYVNGTIMDLQSMRYHMRGCDAIIHLAAVLGVKNADTQLLKCMNVNINGINNVLEAAVMSDIEYIIFSSSSEIFGDIIDEKIIEDHPFNPKSGYAVSKLAGEYLIESFHQEFGINFNIIRFFNIYGPLQVGQFVIPKFIKLALRGEPLAVYGEGNQIRSFCYIQDAVDGVMKVLYDPKQRNKKFNIGNDKEPINMKDLAERIIAGVGETSSTIEFLDFEKSDRTISREIFSRTPDISKIRDSVNYNPQVTLDQGIQNIIKHADKIVDSW